MFDDIHMVDQRAERVEHVRIPLALGRIAKRSGELVERAVQIGFERSGLSGEKV